MKRAPHLNAGLAKLSPVLVALLLLSSCRGAEDKTAARTDTPNIIVIFTDDQGYNDLASYGADIATPHLDRMASEGIRFTDFYVASPVCSASRAAILTGCYPARVSIHGALFPHSATGLNPDETTLAEVCKSKGYATAMFGKWHLGDHADHMPTKQGFDQYFGLPYSNDMWPKHPNNAQFNFPRLPLIENDSTIGYLDEDQRLLTTEYTKRAVQFVNANKDQPFFLYLAHSMPHVPLFVSDRFAGKSERGLYGDVIMELDWSVGEILKTLKDLGIDENTFVIFVSDNGPWLAYGDHAGSAHPLREGKGTALEGGVRVPCIMRWPGRIPGGVVQREPAMTIDLLPTIASLINADLPSQTIDGKDIWPLIVNERDAVSPHDAYYFYFRNNELQGLRSGNWKLYFPHQYQSLNGKAGGTNGSPAPYESLRMGLELYDLESDVGETRNVAGQYPDVVSRLEKFGAACREKLGDQLTGIKGSEVRKPGRVP